MGFVNAEKLDKEITELEFYFINKNINNIDALIIIETMKLNLVKNYIKRVK